MSFATIGNWENAPGVGNEVLQPTIKQTHLSAVLGQGDSDIFFVQPLQPHQLLLLFTQISLRLTLVKRGRILSVPKLRMDWE
jgi:hypothetical protein